MFPRIRKFISHWQDGLIWLPIALAIVVGMRFAIPYLDPRSGVDGLGSLFGYGVLLFKGIIATFMAWLCKTTYTIDLSDDDEKQLRDIAVNEAAFRSSALVLIIIDRLGWLLWIVFWYFVLSG